MELHRELEDVPSVSNNFIQLTRDLIFRAQIEYNNNACNYLNTIRCRQGHKYSMTLYVYMIKHHFRDPLFPFVVLRGLSFHNTS